MARTPRTKILKRTGQRRNKHGQFLPKARLSGGLVAVPLPENSGSLDEHLRALFNPAKLARTVARAAYAGDWHAIDLLLRAQPAAPAAATLDWDSLTLDDVEQLHRIARKCGGSVPITVAPAPVPDDDEADAAEQFIDGVDAASFGRCLNK